ncbi:hypothetical protein FYJ34_03750 [Clostridiaceae bacterium 68-1-5]|uniref:PRTase associated wHTH domain-containing protein n=1 Tax=Suipraeoptans intestinalis TaxID=2606628 RepID=A0A6N7UYI7_9FIRM|nr:hypothetical protein [Suipraeoptans intestinalis]MSR93405.1 hypothetical protein [Suipraeoptans intestinalis]
MEKTTETADTIRLTVQQIGFLAELEKLDKRRGAVEAVSKKFGLVHSKVSRFFKSCVEKGYLTQEFKFTEKGRRLLEWNRRLEKDVRNYLIRTGAKEGIDDLARALFENADYEILEKTIAEYPRIEADASKIQRTIVTDVRDVLSHGRHLVRIAIFQTDARGETKKSMADRGFERYAQLVYGEKESYLELTTRDMHAVSRVNGKRMTGRLASLKYLDAGMVQNAEILDGKVKIPLTACMYQDFGRGIMWGNVMITVACSLGTAHMPESTARLVFIF